MTEERTPKNAPGPFYVVRDECICCGAPEVEARGLMAYDDENSSCFFVRQPANPEEEYRAIRSVWVSCCGAVRYGGTDPAVIRRLERLGVSPTGEARSEPDAAPPRSRLVTFQASHTECASAILGRVGANLLAGYAGCSVSEVAATRGRESSYSIVYSWRDGSTANLTIGPARDGDSRWAISIKVTPIKQTATALHLSDALERVAGLSEFHWHADEESPEWQPLPA